MMMTSAGLTPRSINSFASGINSFLTWLEENGHTSERLRVPLQTVVDTENAIRPLDACTYETCYLILLADFANPDLVILLLVYGSLPFSPYTCTLILCASCGTDGGNPRPSPTTGHSQPNRKYFSPTLRNTRTPCSNTQCCSIRIIR